jgi:hypothetical protein
MMPELKEQIAVTHHKDYSQDVQLEDALYGGFRSIPLILVLDSFRYYQQQETLDEHIPESWYDDPERLNVSENPLYNECDSYDSSNSLKVSPLRQIVPPVGRFS